MQKLLEKAIGYVFLIIGMVITVALVGSLAYFVQGLVFSQLWAWFVAPTFGLPLLPIPVSIGIMLLPSLVKSYDNNKKDENVKSSTIFVMQFVGPLTILLIGFIVHLFVR